MILPPPGNSDDITVTSNDPWFAFIPSQRYGKGVQIHAGINNRVFGSPVTSSPTTLTKYVLVTSTLTFAAASAAAGITVFIGNDIGVCSRNHCTEFETSTAMAFLSWFTALPSFLLNFWLLASR
uniref:CASP-like protein n=1 Tax=Nicotiana tabacum TaxID=4097 RepID=A0A1S3Y9R4_TOBAC|nr:PREDICTED: CASP-like protein 5A2 [Nicotiana tabacum]